MFTLHADELILKDKLNNFLRILDSAKSKAPEGYISELEKIRKDLPSENISVDEQSRALNALMSRLSRKIDEISEASKISLEGLEEDRVFFPPAIDASHEDSTDNPNALILNDICDFGMRLSFFGQDEADKVRGLILEAKNGADTFRLRIIRDQIKADYSYLRERAALTEMFRQDCKEFLSSMKNAKGTETLCSRIEALISSEYISRKDYNEIYKAVCEVFQSQAERIIDSLFASKIKTELDNMGYNLIDESGKPIDIAEASLTFFALLTAATD